MDFRKSLPFKSYGEKRPTCQLVIAHCELFSRTFWTNETQEILEAQPVSRILLYWCRRRKISEKKAAAYTAFDLIYNVELTTVCPFYTLEEPDTAGCVATVIRPRGSGPCAALHMA